MSAAGSAFTSPGISILLEVMVRPRGAACGLRAVRGAPGARLFIGRCQAGALLIGREARGAGAGPSYPGLGAPRFTYGPPAAPAPTAKGVRAPARARAPPPNRPPRRRSATLPRTARARRAGRRREAHPGRGRGRVVAPEWVRAGRAGSAGPARDGAARVRRRPPTRVPGALRAPALLASPGSGRARPRLSFPGQGRGDLRGEPRTPRSRSRAPGPPWPQGRAGKDERSPSPRTRRGCPREPGDSAGPGPASPAQLLPSAGRGCAGGRRALVLTSSSELQVSFALSSSFWDPSFQLSCSSPGNTQAYTCFAVLVLHANSYHPAGRGAPHLTIPLGLSLRFIPPISKCFRSSNRPSRLWAPKGQHVSVHPSRAQRPHTRMDSGLSGLNLGPNKNTSTGHFPPPIIILTGAYGLIPDAIFRALRTPFLWVLNISQKRSCLKYFQYLKLPNAQGVAAKQ